MLNENIEDEIVSKVEKRLGDVLLSVGISANLQGYNFLKESIMLVIESPNYINAITKIMYPAIACKFNTTACRVERAIRHALEVAFNKGKIILLNELFGVKIFEQNDKPTNSEFVALVADRIKLECKMG
jgi:two-component system response regulator (stage 0 sporulation protein A)